MPLRYLLRRWHFDLHFDVIFVIFLSGHHFPMIIHRLNLLVVAGIVDGLVFPTLRQSWRTLLWTAINDKHFRRTSTYIYGFIALLCYKPVLTLKFLLYPISVGRLLLKLRVWGHATKAFETLWLILRRLFGLEEPLNADHLLLAFIVVSRIHLGLSGIRKTMTRVLEIL